MFKKFFIVLFIGAFVLFCLVFKDSGFSKDIESDTEITEGASVVTADSKAEKAELRGVWLTYKEIGALLENKTEEEFRTATKDALKNCSESGLNSVFYHGRAFCDALYFSDAFPLSEEIKGELKFDPLKIFIEEGKKQGIDIHLWINPYRVSYKKSPELLPENSPARTLYKDNKNALLICDNGIYLNPACGESRALVIKGIREILESYQVKGVHFDDYFYPEGEKLGDEKQYKEYRKEGGKLSPGEWRRENVNALISGVYSLIKGYDENLLFTISPAGSIEKCREVFFADVEKWLKDDGFADYIIPQLYFGFENENAPFERLVKDWENAAGDSGKLILGMSPYKCGEIDENAGKGRLEWTERNDVLKSQYEYIRDKECWDGFVLFSYSYCFGGNVNDFSKMEIKKLSDMVK